MSLLIPVDCDNPTLLMYEALPVMLLLVFQEFFSGE
ncbi:Uncharacterised protein [Yersinia enterocolitica]|nr:Uncharacterised protein [Yersinia enterocolitica]CNE05159.1 Uncharacterised protein [Yersinia enterocolitica]